jgi:hypothetical protein
VSLFSVLQLLTEASRVIELRLGMMAVGKASYDELLLMVTEKVEAFQQAGWTMLRGGSASVVVDNYRKVVGENMKRLSR